MDSLETENSPASLSRGADASEAFQAPGSVTSSHLLCYTYCKAWGENRFFFFFSVDEAGSFYLVDKSGGRKARGFAGSQSHHYDALANDCTRTVNEMSWGECGCIGA